MFGEIIINRFTWIGNKGFNCIREVTFQKDHILIIVIKNSAFIYAYEVKIASVNCLYSFPLDIE